MLLLLALLALAMLVAVAYGPVPIPLRQIPPMLLNRLGWARYPVTWEPQYEPILFTFRMPRVVAAAFVGAALATAGALFQGLLRNPMADPYVVGTSGGAALGAVIGMLLGARVSFLGFSAVPLAAFVGALAAMILVVRLAGVSGRLPVVTVLLAGFAVSTLLGYTVSLLIVLKDTLQVQLPQIHAWLLGGVSVVGWEKVGVIGPLVCAAVLGATALSRTLNAFTLGEEGAARLGVSVERDKRLILALGSLLTAMAVSISGLVGFVGLVVPHVIRLLCGPDHRVLIPAAALGGAVFLVLADCLSGALLRNAEVPLGVITAFLGGPFFLWLLRRSRKEYQW